MADLSAGGAALIDQALLELSWQDDKAPGEPTDWDTSLAELHASAKARIPREVEERCRAAKHRANCGLVPQLRHAWASADGMLHIWDYHREAPEVLVVPADSVILSVAFCPPRHGVFDGSIRLVIVLCTRLTVSLVGLCHAGPGALRGAAPGGPLSAGLLAAPPPAHQQGPGLRPVPLEGYSCRTDGALFHRVRYTEDGHVLLACGAPQVYELAYSRSPGWFHSKCRLIRHSNGLRARVRDFLSISAAAAPGRIRLLECAPSNFAATVDDCNTLRLLGLRDQAVNRAESVALLEELAVLTAPALAERALAVARVHLASHVVTHVFLAMGSDGHLRARVVTAARERLLFICSASSAAGPPTGGSDASAGAAAPAGRRCFGFWLQHVSQAHFGAPPASSWGASRGTAAAPGQRRSSCLEEAFEPCLYSAGVWVAGAQRPGGAASEVGVTARLEECGGAAGARTLQTTMTLDAQVLDIAEEGSSAGLLRTPLPALPPVDPGGAPGARSRSFALLMQNGVQVLRVSPKALAPGRPPATAAECCAHLARLPTLPSAPSPGPGDAAGGSSWAWSFDDVRAPTLGEHAALPKPALGRWLHGLLRFLGATLQPLWGAPLVVPVRGRVGSSQGEELRIALSEEVIYGVLRQLHPVLLFARQGLAREGGGAAAAARQPPPSGAQRARAYCFERTGDDEAVARARGALEEVLAVAERAREALALLRALHSQRSAFRVLQSGALDGGARERLADTPLRELVGSDGAMEPVVKLCTATVAESGLATPAPEAAPGIAGRPTRRTSDGADVGRGAARALCRELEEQCPVLFKRVDVAYLRGRLGVTEVHGASTAGELLRCCVQAVAPAPAPDPTAALACSLQTMAAEDPAVLAQDVRATAAADPWGAVQSCAERLQQLQQGAASRGGEAFGAQARALLEALLGAICAAPQLYQPKGGVADAASKAVKHLLLKTGSLGGESQGALPPAHEAILDHLLANPQLHRVLQQVLESTAVDVQGFLRSRLAVGSRAAGEILARHHQAQGRPADASEVLAQLAGRQDPATTLEERARLLQQALAAAQQAAPSSKTVVDRLSAQLNLAVRVQMPLHSEMLLLARDDRVESQWREAAEKRAKELQRLLSLQELYQTVESFGLWHLALLVIDLASDVQDQLMISNQWLRVLLPPNCPYTSRELTQGVFPLLMLRRCTDFFLHASPPGHLPTSAVACPDDFRVRASRLLDELARATDVHGPLWEARRLAYMLEYSSCLWLRATETAAVLPEASAEDSRCQTWVALELLPGRPFHMSAASVTKLYSDMLDLANWLGEFKDMLPPDPNGCCRRLSEDEMSVHLGGVLLAAVRAACGGAPSLERLEAGARGAARAALERLRSRLPAVRGREALRSAAQRLLREVEPLVQG